MLLVEGANRRSEQSGPWEIRAQPKSSQQEILLDYQVSELWSPLCLPEALLSPALPVSCGWVVPELLTVRTPAKLPRGFLAKMKKVASGKIFVKVLAGLKSLSAHPSP